MNAPCPSCASSDVVCIGPISPSPRFAGHHLSEMWPGGSLYRCNACALGYRHPTADKDRLDELYRTCSIGHWQYDPGRRHDWQAAKAALERHIERGAVLDLGCFDGAFQHYLGPDWEGYGIELNLEARERARSRGITLLGDDIAELTRVSQTFDATVAFDVLEHVVDPRAVLEQMKASTRSGGLIVIASGNMDAWSWKLMGSRYWYCTIPEHLAFISEGWCRHAGAQLELDLRSLTYYSHERNRTPARIAREWVTNGLYRFARPAFAGLRTLGVGDKDARQEPDLATYPPTWTTAKDHLVAVFAVP